jgi:hypothetical protein
LIGQSAKKRFSGSFFGLDPFPGGVVMSANWKKGLPLAFVVGLVIAWS